VRNDLGHEWGTPPSRHGLWLNPVGSQYRLVKAHHTEVDPNIVLDKFNAEFEDPSPLEDFDRMHALEPHPTGSWTRQDISKVPNYAET
jgi:hypothetical protein